MMVSELNLYEALSKDLGKEKAKSVVDYIDQKIEKRMEEKTFHLATKEDLAKLETKLTQSVYAAGLVQYVALLASLIAVLKWMVK
jgi:hypothetical protein